MKYKRQTIIDIFTKLGKESFGLWFLDKTEYKFWADNGQIFEHAFYKNGEEVKMPKNIKKYYIYADGKY